MALIPYRDALALLAREEKGQGWAAWCEREGVHQLPVREWVDALAEALRGIGAEKPLEVGSGGGALGRALRERGVPLLLTDPRGGEGVEALEAAAALERHRPDLVLACWLPFDAGGEGRILAHPAVRWCLAVVQTGPGYAGSQALWRAPGWEAKPLEEVNRWAVSRADFLSGVDRGGHVRRGAAFLLARTKVTAPRRGA